MNVQRDPDAILAAWLDAGPVGLPEPTRRAIAVAIRSSNQTRRAAGVPWRFVPMRPMTYFALAVLVVAAVTGSLLFVGGFRNSANVPPSSASPSPTIAPSPTPDPSQAG